MIRRAAKWIGIGLVALILLFAIALLAINTAPGRRFVADRLAGYSTASGLTFRAGRIDGSLYGRMVLHNVEVRDPRGTFATIPMLVVDWRPFAYLHSKIDVRDLDAPSATWLRKPALKAVPSDPNAPLLPDIDLSVRHLHLGRLDVRPAVTGRHHLVSLTGAAEIADRRARIRLDAAALQAAGIAGGDRLRLRLDAVPDANRLAIDGELWAPRGGLVASYAELGGALRIKLEGKGDWSRWRGTARASLDDRAVAALSVTGSKGRFDVGGTLRPGLLLSGPAARLAAPAVTVRLATVLGQRRADVRLQASSDALSLLAGGGLDLGRSRFEQFRVALHLLRPGAIAAGLAAQGLDFTALLDGPFLKPAFQYQLEATKLGFGGTRVTGLAVAGAGVADPAHLRLPVHATAREVIGLNAAAGGLLTHLRLDGTLVYENGKIASDDLHLRSDRIDATAILLADLAKGTYTGALKGRINDYQVNGLGRLNLVTDARLVPGARGGFAVAGKVKLLTRRIDNAGLRSQLGGNAYITADVGYDLAGGATVRNLRLRAPNLEILNGSGFYRPDGRIGLHALARSAAYGPIRLDVTGTLARPQAHLQAARPGLGIGIAGVEASLEGTPEGYVARLRARSDYGPVSAELMLRTGAQGRIDVRSASLAGIKLSGTLIQTPAGPYSGTLILGGSGFTGSIRLSPAGGAQQADLALRAANAAIGTPPAITIGNGNLSAHVLMTATGPSLTGTFALGAVRSGSLTIAQARGRLDYGRGQGHVALVARGGQAGAPFDLAAQAELGASRVVANLKGRVNGVPVSLAAPAVATSSGGSWQIAPVTLVVPQGRVQFSGSVGASTSLHTVLQNVDLSLINAFSPGLGVGGRALGTIDYQGGGAVPTARARIDVRGFTRTAALTVSEPVDIALLATLDQGGGAVRALIRRGDAVVGRLQARLAPLGNGATMAQRLMAAPLSGGIRYNGPAEILWTVTGIGGQIVSGPIAVGADFGGRLAQPSVTGIVRADALRYENETFGTVLTHMAIDGRFTQSQLLLNRLTASAGSGTVAASGRVGLDAARGFPMSVQVTLDRARLARGDDLNATASGTLTITNSKDEGGLVRGMLTIPEARYQIVRQGSAAVPELSGVRRKGAPLVKPDEAAELPSNWKLDIRLRADNRIFVSGMGLEAEWQTDMRLTGTSRAPRLIGRLEVVRGTYSFAGRRLDIDHGIITFHGALTNPELDIAASTTVEGVSATVNIGGYAERPQISFTSTPALPQDEVLSRLLFGSSVTSLSPVQAIQLAAALNSLRGSGGGLNPLGKLRGIAGVDRLRVLGADENAGRGTALAAGKYISNNIYVEIVTDARGFTATQLEISLSRALSILSQTGSFGGSNVSLRYKKVY